MRRVLSLLLGFLAVGGVCASALASSSLPVSPTLLGATAASLQVKPATIVYTGDGTGFLGARNVRNRNAGIHWTKWTSGEALGSGYNQLNDCAPSCAGGSYTGYAVKIEMWRPRTLHGTLVFTRMTIFYEHGRPPKARSHFTFTDSYRGEGPAGFGWGPPSEEGYCVKTHGQPPEASCKSIHTLP